MSLSTEHCEVMRVPAASFATEARLSREAGVVDVAKAKGCDLLGSEKTWQSRQCVFLYAFIYTQKFQAPVWLVQLMSLKRVIQAYSRKLRCGWSAVVLIDLLATICNNCSSSVVIARRLSTLSRAVLRQSVLYKYSRSIRPVISRMASHMSFRPRH